MAQYWSTAWGVGAADLFCKEKPENRKESRLKLIVTTVASLWQGEEHDHVGVNSFSPLLRTRVHCHKGGEATDIYYAASVSHWRQKASSSSGGTLLYWALSTLKVRVGGCMYSPVWPHVMSVWQDAILILQFDDSTTDVRQCSCLLYFNHAQVSWSLNVHHDSHQQLCCWVCLHEQLQSVCEAPSQMTGFQLLNKPWWRSK